MSTEGPPLQSLLHRLTECPADFLLEPRIGNAGVVDVAAVVSDLSRALGGTLLNGEQIAAFRPAGAEEANRLRIALVGAWLLYAPSFREQQRFAAAAVDFLLRGIVPLVPLVGAPSFVSDSDRREELVRLALQALGLRPAGESEAQAADRLETLSSVTRSRIINDTRMGQERARQIREAMRKKAAEEAAAAYGRE